MSLLFDILVLTGYLFAATALAATLASAGWYACVHFDVFDDEVTNRL